MSLALRTDGQNLSFDTVEDAEEIATVSAINNVLSFTDVRGETRYELITAAQAQAELDSGVLGTEVQSNFLPTFITSAGATRAISGITDVSRPVLRIERFSADPNATDDIVLFLQSDTIDLIFGAFPAFPDGFVTNPPNNIIDYFNQGIVRFAGPLVICAPTGVTVTDPMLQPFLILEPFITPNQTSIEAIAVDERTFSSGFNFGAPEVPLCENTPTDEVGSEFSVENVVNFDPAASATGLFATSITQNIAGIDPNDSEVTASLFGPISFSNDEVGGNLTLTLEFAGRRFETDARNLNIFDDLSQAVTVTNQDGVVMVISQDANGDAMGTITVDGVEQGVITQGNGVPIVTFTDNTFVSLQ